MDLIPSLLFPGKYSKSGAVRSARQRLHDRGARPAKRAGGGAGRTHRPPRVQLQPHAAPLPMHAGSDA